MPGFFRRLFRPLAFGALLVGPSAALADAVPLDELSAYLNGISTAQTTFTQVNADGSLATGAVYMHRPGRMRFEYDADNHLVIAGSQRLAIFDGRLRTRPEQYPLRETPLNLILARNVDLARSGVVIDQVSRDGATYVLAQDPGRPDLGTIELVFSEDPVALRQWRLTDAAGAQTVVILGEFEEGMQLRSRLFNINAEIADRLGE